MLVKFEKQLIKGLKFAQNNLHTSIFATLHRNIALLFARGHPSLTVKPTER